MKLSIIIPAYNASCTVEKTVRSVCAAAARVEGGAEVVVMDDGSTDGTPGILDRLSGELGIVVMHQPNSGSYQARLNALVRTSADFVGFVDADDLVDPLMFSKMLALADRENLDVVQCGFDGQGSAVLATRGKILLENRKEVFDAYIYPRLIDIVECSFVWDKIYRNQYDFASFDKTDHVTNFDDLILNTQLFLKVERMGFVNEPLYHHLETEGSAVRTFNARKIRDFKEAVRVRRVLLPKYGVAANCKANKIWERRNWLNCVKMVVKSNSQSAAQKAFLLGRLLKVYLSL